jgi:hypothetical protein
VGKGSDPLTRRQSWMALRPDIGSFAGSTVSLVAFASTHRGRWTPAPAGSLRSCPLKAADLRSMLPQEHLRLLRVHAIPDMARFARPIRPAGDAYSGAILSASARQNSRAAMPSSEESFSRWQGGDDAIPSPLPSIGFRTPGVALYRGSRPASTCTAQPGRTGYP